MLSWKAAPLPPSSDDDVIDAEIVEDGDVLVLLRQAINEAPRMTEARALKRAREIGQELGLQVLPTDLDALPRFPKVLEKLAKELVA